MILGLLRVRVDGLSLRVGLRGIPSLLSVSLLSVSRVAWLRNLHGLGLVRDVLLYSSLHNDKLLATAGRYKATPDPPAKEKGDGYVAARFKVPLLAESEHDAHVGDPGKGADDDPRDTWATAISHLITIDIEGGV